MNSAKEIDSDNLYNIEIADENKQESLMAIDTDSAKESALVIILFFVLIASTAHIGIYGPRLYNKEDFRYRFDKSHNQVLKVQIRTINNLNPFLIMGLSLEKANGNQQISNVEISFKYTLIYKSSNGDELRRDSGSYSNSIDMLNSTTTNSIPFLFEHYISYHDIDIRIDFEKYGDFDQAILSITQGGKSHLKFQLNIRTLFIFVIICVFLLFYSRIQTIQRSQWLLEQRFTVVLQLLSIVGLNPIYILTLYAPSLFQDFLSSFLFHILSSFALLYILIILDYLRFSNQTPGMCHDLPKFIFFILQFIIEILYPLMYHGLELIGIEGFSHNLVNFVEKARMLFAVIFVIWLISLIISVFRNTDSTQRNKLISYSFVFSGIAIVYIFDVFFSRAKFIQNTSGMFTLKYSSLFALAILMAYFHWPYTTSIDQEYHDPHKDKEPENIFESDDQA